MPLLQEDAGEEQGREAEQGMAGCKQEMQGGNFSLQPEGLGGGALRAMKGTPCAAHTTFTSRGTAEAEDLLPMPQTDARGEQGREAKQGMSRLKEFPRHERELRVLAQALREQVVRSEHAEAKTRQDSWAQWVQKALERGAQ